MSDFTFNEFLTGILKFNDENVMHIGFNADTEDIIIKNWNAAADTAKTLQTNLNGGGGGAVLGPKTITANGTYDASDDSLDGYDQVTVNVPETGITVEQLATNSAPTGDIVLDSSITTLGTMAFAGKPIKTFTGPGVTTMTRNCFGDCALLESASFPNLITFKGFNINNASDGKVESMTKLLIPKVERLDTQVFTQMPALENLALPSLTGNPSTNHLNFTGSGIKVVDIGENFGDFASAGFSNANNVETVILRKQTQISLGNTSCFNSTKLAVSGSGGEIYVPSALLTDYETGTNWSALNATYKAIEGSYYETHYADGTEVTP